MFRVGGSGLGVQVWVFRVGGSGLGVQGWGFWAWSSELGVQGSGLRVCVFSLERVGAPPGVRARFRWLVKGSGCRVQGAGLKVVG